MNSGVPMVLRSVVAWGLVVPFWVALPSWRTVKAEETSSSLHATATLFIEFDEDRAWVTEVLDAAPAGPQAVSLAPDERRFTPPSVAQTGGHGGLRVGQGATAPVLLVDGALVVPEQLPPEGVSAFLEYSLPADGQEVSFERQYPVTLQELRVSVTSRVPGVTLQVGDAMPVATMHEVPGFWTVTVRRVEPLAAGESITVRVAGLPTYETPVWASLLLLAGAAAALGGLVAGRIRFKSR